jgi:FKBP-type peptidyl-prolyl cis-trans isomerase (trigger factor)
MAIEVSNETSLQLEVEQTSPSSCKARVIIPLQVVEACYQHALIAQQKNVLTHGFVKGSVPLEYIAQNFSMSITNYLKEFLFNYFVLSFLQKEMRNRKLLVAGEPRLESMQVAVHQSATFTFQISLLAPLEVREWKHLPFKAPKRKKYKDLDRQVDAFIKEELEQAEKPSKGTAQMGDLICVDIQIVYEHNKPFFNQHTETVWFRLGEEEGDQPLRELFLGKAVGEHFCTSSRSIQTHFSDQLDIDNLYCITILDLVHANYFCLDQFKRFFKLKTNKEAYQKLIEVFSYRNDLSQRRSMAEEALKLLLSKHKFEVPNHVILRQQEKVLIAVQSNPDYHVYRVQKDFEKRTRQLAEKQIKEYLLLDQIAYLENITCTHDDVKQYLNLISRPRTKEFIYFDIPSTRRGGQEAPIPAQELMKSCLREKTINYIIYHLTRA